MGAMHGALFVHQVWPPSHTLLASEDHTDSTKGQLALGQGFLHLGRHGGVGGPGPGQKCYGRRQGRLGVTSEGKGECAV